MRVDVSKNFVAASSAKDGEFETSTTTDAPSRTSASPFPPVDSSITQLVFALTDFDPQYGCGSSCYEPLVVTRPNGQVVSCCSDPSVSYGYPNNGRVITIKSIGTSDRGNWTVAVPHVLSTKAFQLSVTGDGTLQLNRFALVQASSDIPHPGNFDIDGYPPAGQTLKGLAELDGAFSTANFELRSKTGAVLTCPSGCPSPSLNFNPAVTGDNEFYGDVPIPSQTFLAYVKGSRSDGTQYQRVSDKDFVPPTVTVSARLASFFNPE